MIRVRVYLYHSIRERLGRPEAEVHLHEGAGLSDLMLALASQVHPLFLEIGATEDSLYAVNLLIRNGERVDWKDPVRLESGDELHLIPPLEGGE